MTDRRITIPVVEYSDQMLVQRCAIMRTEVPAFSKARIALKQGPWTPREARDLIALVRAQAPHGVIGE